MAVTSVEMDVPIIITNVRYAKNLTHQFSFGNLSSGNNVN